MLTKVMTGLYVYSHNYCGLPRGRKKSLPPVGSGGSVVGSE